MFIDNLNRIIKELKKSKKISQADIAEKIGMSASGFTDWLKGRGSPSPDTITKLAEVLGVKVTDLIDEPQEKTGNITNSFNNLGHSVTVNGSGSVIINNSPNQQITKLSKLDHKLLSLPEDKKKLVIEFFEFLEHKKKLTK